MQASPTALPGVLLLTPQQFSDARGVFFESYNSRTFTRLTGQTADFVQDNHSCSVRGVLRGLHYQVRRPQGKLVRVVAGEIFDVVVDLRRHSPAFGQWTGVHLSAANRQQVWIPPGFAHGYLALSEMAECIYKTTEYWAPELERCIRWDDPTLGIDWPVAGVPILSDKDIAGLSLHEAEVFD